MATVRGYLLAIARNVHRKSAAHRRRHVALPDDLRGRGPDPTAAVEARSSLSAIDARLAALPEVDRAALLMRTLEDTPVRGDRPRARHLGGRGAGEGAPGPRDARGAPVRKGGAP